MGRVRGRIGRTLACALGVMALTVPVGQGVVWAARLPAAQEVDGGGPALAYYTDDDRVRVTDVHGRALTTLPPFQFFSLDGEVVAGSRAPSGDGAERVVAREVTSGRRLFTIEDAWGPVVTAGGRKVVFAPDRRLARRDPWGSSLWLRDAKGREHRVFQLTGPRATVDSDPFEGDGGPLGWAVDRAGRTLAVSIGNDLGLFQYDIWTVDLDTREATRITRGKSSRYPSVSPSGDRVVYVREVDHCGGPGGGYRASRVEVVSSQGRDRQTILDGSCARYHTDPLWLSEDTLATVQLTRVAPGRYSSRLVLVDVASGTLTRIRAGGNVTNITASARLGLVAFHLRGQPGFGTYAVAAGTLTHHPEGWIPHVAGEHRLL